MFIKLIKNNLKRNKGNHYIYIYASSLCLSLIYFSCFISNSKMIDINIDSFVILITLLSFTIINYVSKFNFSRRAREIGIYNLFGLRMLDICKMLLVEYIIIDLIAVLIGYSLGGLISFLFETFGNEILVIGIGTFKNSFMQSLIIYILIELINIIRYIYFTLTYSPKKLLYNESTVDAIIEKKTKYSGLGLLFFLIIYILFIITILIPSIPESIKKASMSIIVIPVFFMIITFFYNILNISYKIRKDSVLNKNVQLLLSSIHFIANSRKNMKLIIALTFVQLFSIISFLSGYIFLNSRYAIIDIKNDKIMGLYQIILSLTFLIIIFCILFIRQFNQIDDYKNCFFTCKKLGFSDVTMKRYLINQLNISYVLVCIINFIVTIVPLVLLNRFLFNITGVSYVILGFFVFFIINIFLYILFYILSYNLIIKNIDRN